MSDVSGGKTFWDWFTGPHKVLKDAFVSFSIVASGVGLGALGYLISGNLGYGVAFAGLYFLAFVMFYIVVMWILSKSDGAYIVVLPVADKPPSILSIGPGRMRDLTLSGNLNPLITSSGRSVLFVETYDEAAATCKASWIHEVGRTEFIRKSEVYEKAIDVAEDLYKQYLLIKDIPRLMSARISGKSIQVYEDEKLRDMTSLDPVFDKDEELLRFLRDLRDPVEALKEVDP